MPLPLAQAPDLSLPLLQGDTWTLAGQSDDTFTIVVFYRGHHCPICKTYMKEIDALIDQAATQGIGVVAVSMDGHDRATATHEEIATTKLRIAYGMTEETAREWGLYISSNRPGTQEPEVFAEPGLFVIRPDGTVFFAQTQSAPFTRPDFGKLLGGLKFVVENDYPARGDLTAAAA
ncbi:MAG: peroxiredoxin-like family protein [Pseudomonadota bacterium]